MTPESLTPIINGKFYMNPAQGRGVERARIAQDLESADSGSAEQSQTGHWVTINGRHVQINGEQASHTPPSTPDRIAATAKKYDGSTDWAFDKRKDNFPAGTNKCNKFVYDVTKEAGAQPIVIGSDGKPRPPLAGEWADPRTSIPGWRVLGPNETPRPGDVAAYKLPGNRDFTGHSGIVTSVDATGTVHGIAAHRDVVGPVEKFNGSPERGVKFRRYTGGR
jgi:hypothetical protein